MTEADKARNVMQEEGLEWEQLQVNLIYALDSDGLARTKALPDQGPGLGRFLDYFDHLDSPAYFFGILWVLEDRETGKFLDWLTTFAGVNEAVLRQIRNKVASLSGMPPN